MTVHAVVLAAGLGTRMKSDLAKVLHRAAGRPLVSWSLDALDGISDVTVVVGHQAADVEAVLPEGVRSVVQEPQNGTGHAVEVALDGIELATGDVVLVMPGDMPLIGAATVVSLLEAHAEKGAAATVLTATVADPTGYGRIVRDPDGVTGIVEHRDAGPEVRAIDEINTSVYAFEADALRSTLPEIGTGNRQGERYLTDAIGILVRSGRLVHAVGADAAEALGVNSHAELAVAAGVLRSRINTAWMESGVAMADPERVYIDAGVRLAPGVEVYPDVHLEGATTRSAPTPICGPERAST
jgi:bifunctional UDP-N-acetylglucosamine pyrophosphorylase/glucosamine-1-phosphate N-acetyltransferase